jgi:hypothetical protein
MQNKHSYVVLIDLPEALVFQIKKRKELKDLLMSDDEDPKKIFEFVKVLEKVLGEEMSYIGEDMIAEKFYRRFILPKEGFIEIMSESPAVIIAHFIERGRAEKFASALKNTIRQVVKDKGLAEILVNLVEVCTEKEEPMTYQKWSEMKDIRKLVEE